MDKKGKRVIATRVDLAQESHLANKEYKVGMEHQQKTWKTKDKSRELKPT